LRWEEALLEHERRVIERQNWLKEFENNCRRNTIHMLTLRIQRKMQKKKKN